MRSAGVFLRLWVFALAGSVMLAGCEDAPRVGAAEAQPEVARSRAPSQRVADPTRGDESETAGDAGVDGGQPFRRDPRRENGEPRPVTAPPPQLATSEPTPGESTEGREPGEREASSLEERLEQARRRLKSGRIAFPERMRMHQGEQSRVTIRVSETGDVSREGLAGEVITEQPIQLSPVMVACLEATPGEFEVRGTTGDVASSKPEDTTWRSCRQKTVAGDSTEWSWLVKPLVAGKLQLALSVETRLFVEGRSFDGPGLPRLSRTIEVVPDTGYVVTTFLREHWQWLLGTLLGTGALFPLLRWLRQRKRHA